MPIVGLSEVHQMHLYGFSRHPAICMEKNALKEDAESDPTLRWRVSKLIFAPARKRQFPFLTKQISIEWQTAH